MRPDSSCNLDTYRSTCGRLDNSHINDTVDAQFSKVLKLRYQKESVMLTVPGAKANPYILAVARHRLLSKLYNDPRTNKRDFRTACNPDDATIKVELERNDLKKRVYHHSLTADAHASLNVHR